MSKVFFSVAAQSCRKVACPLHQGFTMDKISWYSELKYACISVNNYSFEPFACFFAQSVRRERHRIDFLRRKFTYRRIVITGDTKLFGNGNMGGKSYLIEIDSDKIIKTENRVVLSGQLPPPVLY